MSRKSVTIIGRPNVGKSSLFNRLVGYRKAIVFDKPGVTVDNNRALAKSCSFFCIDTVGFTAGCELSDIGLAVVVFDGRDAVHADDRLLVSSLRCKGCKTIFTVNKIDSASDEHLLWPFYQLGLSELSPLSALRNIGIASLIDKIENTLRVSTRIAEENRAKVVLVGRRNAGKSLLLNKLASITVATVSAEAGTTRDSIDWHYRFKSNSYTLTDTAGLRRKARHTRDKIEFLSMTRTLRAIREAQVVAVVVDATQGVVQQDMKITAMSLAQYKPTLIILNKWDLMDKSQYDKIKKEITESAMPWAGDLPIVVTSALTNLRVSDIKDWVESLHADFQKRIPTAELNRTLAQITERHRPRVHGGRRLNFYYAAQVETQPPVFVVKCSVPEAVTLPYQRYLATNLRRELGFTHIPIKVLYQR